MGCTRYWITHLLSSSIVVYGVSKFWSWSDLDNAKFLQLVFPSLSDKKGFLWSKIKGRKNGKVYTSETPTIHSKEVEATISIRRCAPRESHLSVKCCIRYFILNMSSFSHLSLNLEHFTKAWPIYKSLKFSPQR